MAGDFYLFFDSKLDAEGVNSTIKKKSSAERIELKQNHDICDVWRVKNTKSKPFLQLSFYVCLIT